jgi:hypothetical protein
MCLRGSLLGLVGLAKQILLPCEIAKCVSPLVMASLSRLFLYYPIYMCKKK